MNRARYIIGVILLLAGCGGIERRNDPPPETSNAGPVAVSKPMIREKEQQPDVQRSPKSKPGSRRIQQLIQNLGDDEYWVREKATQKLLKIGKTALPLLVKATQSDDMEVRERAERLVAEIWARFAQNHKLLAEAVRYGKLDLVKKLISEGPVDLDVVLPNGSTFLHLALQVEHVDVARLLIDSGASVDGKDSQGWTALHRAAREGTKEICEFLLASGAGASVKDNEGLAPLDFAIKYRRAELAKLLLGNGAWCGKEGYALLHVAGAVDAPEELVLRRVKELIACNADVNTKDSRGYTALHRTRSREIAEILVDSGAVVDARNSDGNTPLHLAARRGDREVVELLIVKNADLDARGKRERTSLILAAWYGRAEVVRLLIEAGADVHAKDYFGKAPLNWVGGIESVKLLVAAGAKVNGKENSGATPLHRKVIWGDDDVVAFLISKGADVNAKDKFYGYTPLHLAAGFGEKSRAQMLLAAGANVHASSNEGYTPLHLAFRKDMVELLLAAGAGVNARASDGSTPLHFMCEVQTHYMLAHGLKGQARSRVGKERKPVQLRGAMEFLIDRGADVNVRDNAGKRPLDRAEKGNKELVDLVRKHGGMSCDDIVNLEHAAKTGDTETLKKYIARGGDANSTVFRGKTLLHWAAFAKRPGAAQYLIKNGACVGSVDEMGQTPLHFTAAEGNREIAEMLLEAGADVNAKDKLGMTPLHDAVLWEKGKMIDFLVSKGGDVNSLDASGCTPLDAVDDSNRELEKLLRKHGARTAEELKKGQE